MNAIARCQWRQAGEQGACRRHHPLNHIKLLHYIKMPGGGPAIPVEQNIHDNEFGKHAESRIEREERDSEVRSHTTGQMIHDRMKCSYPL